MKKVFSLFIAIFIVFFMFGCNTAGNTTVNILPDIEVIGDTVMEIEQYNDFVDPGAEIIGDFDLDITVESNVDTSTLGEYTITYTINYLGTDYSVSRIVKVVEKVSTETPSLTIIGDETIEVEQYSIFVDPGVEVIGDFDLDIIVESNVDTSTLGSYIIVYTITYLGVDYSLTRNIEIVPRTTTDLPSIELIGDETIEVEQFSDFVDLGAKIIGDFDLEITVESNVNTSIVGEYQITYSITYDSKTYSITRTVKVINSSIPSIELIGDSVMEIEQYTDFSDPGAEVIGDFDLEITVESNVNTSIAGKYQVTYSITYDSKTYSVTRIVNVIAIEDPFTILLELGEVTQTSISVIVNVDDSNDIINNKFVRIYNGYTLIESIEYVNGINNIEFNGLEDGTTYRVVVSGDYLDNGNTATLQEYDLEITTVHLGEIDFNINDLYIDYSSIGFDLEVIDEDNMLTNLVVNLYNGEELVATANLYDMLNSGEYEGNLVGVYFYDLDELTTYSFEIVYNFIQLGSTEETTITLEKIDYTTSELVVPTIISNTINERYYNLDCEAEIDFSGFEDYSVWAELYNGSTFVQYQLLVDNSSYSFSYIDTATDYTIKIYASYTDIATGDSYSSILIGTFEASTLTAGDLATPVVENVVITKTETSVTVDFDLIDSDNAMDMGYLRLYYGSYISGYTTIVKGHNTFTFDNNVDENTLYTVKIDVDYNGDGSFTTLYEEDVYTPPVITVSNFVPNDMFYVGNHIVMKLDIDNDEDVSIDFVIINGTRYSTFIFPSDNQTLYIDMGIDNVAHTYTINLENIGITLGTEEYLINMTTSLDITIYEVGSIAPDDATVEVIDIVPESYFVNINEDDEDETTPLLIDIYLNNKYNLDINSITIGGINYDNNDITVIDSNHIQVTAYFSYGSGNSNNTLYFSEITFSRNGEIASNNQANNTVVSIYEIYDFDRLTSTLDVIHVSTPEDLMNVEADSTNPSRVYILDNDIDMTGYDFVPIGTYDNPFTGAFNGNGYTISNITINQSFDEDNNTYYVGMFGYSRGFIANLNLENVNISISSSGDSFLYVGALAGRTDVRVYNVHVYNSTIIVGEIVSGEVGGLIGFHASDLIYSSADTDITITSNTTISSSYILRVGGLVGNKFGGDVRNSYASGDISITSENTRTVFVGGLLGYIYNAGSSYPNYVSNSYATGNITTTGDYYSRIGGLIGDTYMYSTSTIIMNSFATGDVYTTGGTIGGLIGETCVKIYSSFAIGNVTNESGTISRLFGKGNNYNLVKIYAYDGQLLMQGENPTVGSDYYYENIGVASATQFNDSNYYIEFLGWSAHFYDFSNLDIENNDLPTLK